METCAAIVSAGFVSNESIALSIYGKSGGDRCEIGEIQVCLYNESALPAHNGGETPLDVLIDYFDCSENTCGQKCQTVDTGTENYFTMAAGQAFCPSNSIDAVKTLSSQAVPTAILFYKDATTFNTFIFSAYGAEVFDHELLKFTSPFRIDTNPSTDGTKNNIMIYSPDAPMPEITVPQKLESLPNDLIELCLPEPEVACIPWISNTYKDSTSTGAVVRIQFSAGVASRMDHACRGSVEGQCLQLANEGPMVDIEQPLLFHDFLKDSSYIPPAYAESFSGWNQPCTKESMDSFFAKQNDGEATHQLCLDSRCEDLFFNSATDIPDGDQPQYLVGMGSFWKGSCSQQNAPGDDPSDIWVDLDIECKDCSSVASVSAVKLFQKASKTGTVLIQTASFESDSNINIQPVISSNEACGLVSYSADYLNFFDGEGLSPLCFYRSYSGDIYESSLEITGTETVTALGELQCRGTAYYPVGPNLYWLLTLLVIPVGLMGWFALSLCDDGEEEDDDETSETFGTLYSEDESSYSNTDDGGGKGGYSYYVYGDDDSDSSSYY